MSASAWTLEEARNMLDLWKACEVALATGQAKSYKIGTREYTALDLNEIAGRIHYWANMVEALSGRTRTTRVTRVVPRDL